MNSASCLPSGRRFPGAGQCGVCLLVVLGLITLTSATGAADEAFLSDRPEWLIEESQQWGALGWDTAAHVATTAGEPLRIGDRTFSKGLGHHAAGRLVFLLPDAAQRFEAEVGLQPCGGGGSVVFRVLVDGQTRFESGVRHAGEPSLPVSVPLSGAGELALESADAGDGISCDMANWANARIVGAPLSAGPAIPEPRVDVAPFGTIVTCDPGRTDGARATRLEEFRAEDIFLESEIFPGPDGGEYVLPARPEGGACVGVTWAGQRAVQELRLEFAANSRPARAEDVRVEGWFGESRWQGRWLALTNDARIDGNLLIHRLGARAPSGGVLRTRKVRWIIPTTTPVLVRRPQVFTRSRWDDVEVVVEAETPERGVGVSVRVADGELLSPLPAPDPASDWRLMDLAAPRRLRVRQARSAALGSENTVLQFHVASGGLSVALADLAAHPGVYVPLHGLYLRLARDDRPTLAEYRRQFLGRTSVLTAVRSLPDQTLAQALAKTHHPAQREGPVLLSLAADNTKVILERNGVVRFPTTTSPDDDWIKTAAHLEPTFGPGQERSFDRRLRDRWHPVPVITRDIGGLGCRQMAFVAPDPNRASSVGGRPRPVAVVEFTVENPTGEPREASIDLALRGSGSTHVPISFVLGDRGKAIARCGAITVAAVTPPSESVAFAVDPATGRLRWTARIPAGRTARAAVYIGATNVVRYGTDDVGTLHAAVVRHWENLLSTDLRIETPAPLLDDLYRSSLVRCWIDAREEADGARLAPWIAAMSYGPLESEAHSVIRGMSSCGDAAFARRGLDFFVHRYNPAGFLTTGYTTFGTAWHLWTLGEFARLHAATDAAWVREVQPETARVGEWILRQLEKSRRLDARGRPVPEHGLMPPAVLADWNAYADHFALNGYYLAALRHVAELAAEAGDSRAPRFATAAGELRDALLRAWRNTQSLSPVVPLRDGSWVPPAPSQVHSPGPLARFFPGDDAGRSWAYDVELGAHQLVPTGVFAPDDPEVTRLLDYLEDVQFLGDGWFDYPAKENQADWFNLGGFAKVQPFYARNAEVYALRDDVKPFLRSYFNATASLLNPEVLTFWEHFHHSGAWDKTHETGYFLHYTRLIFVQERGPDLWLAPFLPAEWLAAGAEVRVANAPTRFGRAGFRLRSHLGEGWVDVELTAPDMARPESIVMRFRHPEGKPIRTVEGAGWPGEVLASGTEVRLRPPKAGAATRLSVRF